MNCPICHKPVSEHRDELMCCWACGSPVWLIQDHYNLYLSDCSGCDAGIGGFDSPSALREQWNRRASTWRRYPDEAPRDGITVLIYAPEILADESIQGYLEDGVWYCCGGHFSFPARIVTHWMPLPQLPEER